MDHMNLRLSVGVPNLRLLGGPVRDNEDDHEISRWVLKPEIVDWFEDNNIPYEYWIGIVDFTCEEDMMAFKLAWM